MTNRFPRFRTYVKRGKNGQCWVSYWYDKRGTGERDVPLGNNYEAALIKWRQIHEQAPREKGTIEEAFKRWEAEVLPTYESAETRRDYAKSLKQLRPVFGPAMWSTVRLPTLRQYLDKRSGKTRANREISTLQIIWNWARLEDLHSLPWPAHGMSRSRWKNKEQAREVEVSDEAFNAIYRHADPVLRDAMDIATATGLRVRDTLKLRLTDVRDGWLVVQASKTHKRAEFDLAGSILLPLIERRKQAKAEHFFLLNKPTKRGGKVSERMLADRFTKAREAAAREAPECATLMLRDMRKRAAQLADTLQDASRLLQHSSESVTRRHYRRGDRLKVVR